MARRLVAAGVRFVTLTYGGWDMHNQHHRRHARPDAAVRSGLRAADHATSIAAACSTTTLVMVCSEFGRTPKINSTAGRDHWPKVFSVMLAGGGIKGGTIYGTSNATASEPESDAVGPEDLATTVYHQLGIVADKELMAPGDRPIEIVDGGKVDQGPAGVDREHSA